MSIVTERAHPQRATLPTELPDNAGKLALGTFLVLLAQLMLVLDATVVNVALPRISTDLDFTPAGLSWVLNGYTLAFGGLLLLGGRLGDVYGRRRVFVLGLSVFAVFSFVAGIAGSAEVLVAARALQGAGAALAAPSVLALLTTNAPDDAARNRALALFSAVASGGAALGLILGGALTDALSWRWTMFINVPIALVVVLTIGRFVAETPRRPGRFDVVGAVAATGGAVAIVWSLIGVPDHGWASTQTIAGLALGVVLLGVLAAAEVRVPHPLLRPALLRSRPRVTALVVMAALYGGMLAMFFVMVQVLEAHLGYGPLKAGFAFLPMPVGIFTMSRFSPRLVALVGRSPLIALGSAGVLAAFVRLTMLDGTSGYWDGVFVSLALIGVSMGITFMPITSLVLSGVEPEHAGSASGLLQTVQQLGGAVGLAVVATTFAQAADGDFVDSARAAFTAAAVLTAVAFAAALSLVVRRPAPAVALAD
ncbi:MAG TPA: MFS transporter [Nocardioides sp.]|nr:MFS transporter [Nocardioides sp.]